MLTEYSMVVHTSSSSSSSSSVVAIRRRGGRMTNNSLSSLTTTSQYQSLTTTTSTNDAAANAVAADNDNVDNEEDDPPFHKFGHPHIGKRVRYYFYPPSSNTSNTTSTTKVYIDGTITGYLSPHDVDSKNAPAFICTRTHRPASLFHVEFDPDNIYYKYKDLEGFELEECCTWLELPTMQTSSSSAATTTTTGEDDNTILAGVKEGGVVPPTRSNHSQDLVKGAASGCGKCKRQLETGVKKRERHCASCPNAEGKKDIENSSQDGIGSQVMNISNQAACPQFIDSLVLSDFSSTELASKYRIVTDTFDSSLLIHGQLVAFGATRDKTATRRWVVGNISALYVNKVHWARVKVYSNREYVFATSETARDTYGKEWYFVTGYGEEEGGVVVPPPPRLHSSSLFPAEASWVCHNPNCKRINQVTKKRVPIAHRGKMAFTHQERKLVVVQ